MKMKYKIYYIFLCLAVLAAFTGAYKILEVKEVSQKQIEDTISQCVHTANMNKDNGQAFRKIYGLNKRDFNQFIYYSPKSNMQADEILILKSDNDSMLKSAEDAIEERINKQSDSFKNYNKEQYEILKNHTLESRDGYIILIVSKDSDNIKHALDNIF